MERVWCRPCYRQRGCGARTIADTDRHHKPIRRRFALAPCPHFAPRRDFGSRLGFASNIYSPVFAPEAPLPPASVRSDLCYERRPPLRRSGECASSSREAQPALCHALSGCRPCSNGGAQPRHAPTRRTWPNRTVLVIHRHSLSPSAALTYFSNTIGKGKSLDNSIA